MSNELGSKVKDPISGFKGIVVSSHNYLHGCTRVTVQPKIGRDGKLPDTATFDLPQLDIIERHVASKGNTVIGGPSKYEDESR